MNTTARALFFALPSSLASVDVAPPPAVDSSAPIVAYCSACGDDLAQRVAIHRHNIDCATTGERSYRVNGRTVVPTPRTTFGRIV